MVVLLVAWAGIEFCQDMHLPELMDFKQLFGKTIWLAARKH